MTQRLIKILSLFLSFCLIFEQTVFAQTIDLSHYFARNSSQTISQSDKFRPLHLRYVSYDSQANDFKILLDKGDFFNQKTEKPKNEKTLELEKTTQELMKYFFIGLSLPNEKFWVNLRPDSPDNILDPDLEKTDIGRIFLEADLQLKKDTSGMTSPQTKEGREYWNKLYKKAGELFGSVGNGRDRSLQIPTITRPWIVPGEIIIGESADGAYIYKATLKVMLEDDYLSSRQSLVSGPGSWFLSSDSYLTADRRPQTGDYINDPRLKELNEYSTHLIKETIIPKLTYEVNTSKRYAPLRQVYYSLVLAQWFKQKYSSSGSVRASGIRAPVNSYIDLIDSGNLANLASMENYDKQAYFKQYQKSFQEGEYNLQEPIYTPTGQVIRRYISGGMLLAKSVSSAVVYPIKEPPQNKAYLLASEAASPVRRSDGEIAQELTDTLLDPARENERLFIWAETVTPKVFKKIVENIEREENQTQENKEIKIRNLIIRILTDTAGLKEETYYSEDKTQKALFREIINDYIAFANMKAPEDENLFASFFSTQTMPINEPENPEPAIILKRQILETHMSEYKGRFGITDETGKYYYKESIETIFNIAKDMKTNLRSEKILNEPTLFLYIWDICLALYRQSAENLTRIDDLLEKMIYPKTKRSEIWHNEIKYLEMKLLKLKPLTTGQEFPYDYESSFKINTNAGDKNLKCRWNTKEKNLYIQNSDTGHDIWLQFLGKVNIFYVSWFNENINEFESSKENIPLPADGIIDLTLLTRYEGVKRLLASSSAAENKRGVDDVLTDMRNRIRSPDNNNNSFNDYLLEMELIELLGIYGEGKRIFYPFIGNDIFLALSTTSEVIGTNMRVSRKIIPLTENLLHSQIPKLIAFAIKEGGLPEDYNKISVPALEKRLKILEADTFNYNSYFNEIGEINVLFIKGVSEYAKSYRAEGVGSKVLRMLDNKIGNYTKEIEEHIKDFIKEVDRRLLSNNGYIVIADDSYTPELGDFLINGLGYIDFLKQPGYEEIGKVLGDYAKSGKNGLTMEFEGIEINAGRRPILIFKKASSGLASNKGGIDFSHPEIMARPVSELQALAGSPLAINPNLDFETEWRGIQMVFTAGVRPSARRIAEFAVSAAASPLNIQRIEDVRGLITDLLRRDEEEERPAPAEPELKELITELNDV